MKDWAPMKPLLAETLCWVAKDAYPMEACGFVIEDIMQHFLPITNVHQDPLHNFEMDPTEQLRAMEQYDKSKIIGVYHTHPHGPNGPSPADMEFPYDDMRYFIVTMFDVFEWRFTDGVAHPVQPDTGETGSSNLAYPVLSGAKKLRP